MKHQATQACVYIILYEIEDTIQGDVEHKTAFYNDKVVDDQRTPWAKEEECQTHHQQLHLTPFNLKPQTSKSGNLLSLGQNE